MLVYVSVDIIVFLNHFDVGRPIVVIVLIRICLLSLGAKSWQSVSIIIVLQITLVLTVSAVVAILTIVVFGSLR